MTKQEKDKIEKLIICLGFEVQNRVQEIDYYTKNPVKEEGYTDRCNMFYNMGWQDARLMENEIQKTTLNKIIEIVSKLINYNNYEHI